MTRVLGFVLLVGAAVVAVLVTIDDGSASLGRIAAEAALIGVAAYLISHLVWPRWRARHGRRARASNDLDAADEPSFSLPGPDRPRRD